VYEIHPELSFCSWNGQPLSTSKKTEPGFNARLELVEREFSGGYLAVRRCFRKSVVGDDDILDAFAALWTARRGIAGEAKVIAGCQRVDRLGLRMEMLA